MSAFELFFQFIFAINTSFVIFHLYFFVQELTRWNHFVHALLMHILKYPLRARRSFVIHIRLRNQHSRKTREQNVFIILTEWIFASAHVQLGTWTHAPSLADSFLICILNWFKCALWTWRHHMRADVQTIQQIAIPSIIIPNISCGVIRSGYWGKVDIWCAYPKSTSII